MYNFKRFRSASNFGRDGGGRERDLCTIALRQTRCRSLGCSEYCGFAGARLESDSKIGRRLAFGPTAARSQTVIKMAIGGVTVSLHPNGWAGVGFIDLCKL